MQAATSALHRYFKLDELGSNVRTEIIAGAALFLGTVVQPTLTAGILADAGMDRTAVFTAGTLIIILSCLMYATWLNKPFMCGPSIGISPWIAYTIILTMGIPWQMAMATTVVSGVAFLVLSLIGFREKILGAIPLCLKYSFASGIGAFITVVGLLSVGIIVTDPNSFFGLSLGNLTALPILMGVVTMVLIAIMYINKIKGAFLIGILFYTFVGVFLTDPATGARLTSLPEGGLVSVVSPFQALAPTFMQFSFGGASEIFANPILGVGIVVFTIFFIDVFDTIGTLSGLCTVGGCFMDEKGNIPDLGKMFIIDATATTVGGALGVSMATTYIENSIGLAEGGRSGLTAYVNGFLFALTLFLAPLFTSVPSIATGAAIALIGPLLMVNITKVNFSDYSEALPAFFCIFMMPFTGNMGIGILVGIFLYVIAKAFGKREKVSPMLWGLAIVFVLYIISQQSMFL